MKDDNVTDNKEENKDDNRRTIVLNCGESGTNNNKEIKQGQITKNMPFTINVY